MTFIANELFTAPQGHHQQDIPSSSHPPIPTSPSLPVVPTSPLTHIPSPHDDPSTSPSTHIPSPHDDPPSSPSHNPSPSSHDTTTSNNDEDNKADETEMIDIEPFPLTYQRGYRHVFATLKRQGAMPSTSAKQLDKGKEKVIVEEEDTHETEQEFQLIDLEDEDEDEERITNMLLKTKDAKISELQANLGRAKNVINFLELENQQLETK